MIKFKIWLEAIEDLYGFQDIEDKIKTEPPKPEDELPIQSFSLNRLMNMLSRTKLGELPVHRPFEDQIQWGSNDGAIRARLTPNQGVSIERMTSDLQGKPLWVTKKLVKMKTNDHAGQEDNVATEIGDILQQLSGEQVDSATANYNSLPLLTRKMAESIKGVSPAFTYEEIKKINDNNYNILMQMNGGVGKIAHRIRGPAFTSAGIIDLSYDPERGSIKTILTTVDIENEGGAWTIDIPYFMGDFVPSQPIEEIVRAVAAGLRFI